MCNFSHKTKGTYQPQSFLNIFQCDLDENTNLDKIYPDKSNHSYCVYYLDVCDMVYKFCSETLVLFCLSTGHFQVYFAENGMRIRKWKKK